MTTQILNHDQITKKLNRIAFQIYEENAGEQEIILAGIASRGYLLAEKLKDAIQKLTPMKVKLQEIRLDKENTRTSEARLDMDPSELKDRTVIVVDDVLNSGKTLIYGVRYFLDYPVKRIMTAVLIDRSHRNFPVHTDFAGLRLSTTLLEHVSVKFETEMSVHLE